MDKKDNKEIKCPKCGANETDKTMRTVVVTGGLTKRVESCYVCKKCGYKW